MLASLFAVALLSASSAQSATTYWTGTGTDTTNSWNSSNNWNGGIPDSSSDVVFNDTNFTGFSPRTTYALSVANSLSFEKTTGSVALVLSSSARLTLTDDITVSGAATNQIQGGSGSTGATPAVAAVNLTINTNFAFGNADATTTGNPARICTVSISGTTTIGASGSLSIADMVGSMNLGVLEMSGGTFQLTNGTGAPRGTTDGGTNNITVTRLNGSGTLQGNKTGATLITTGHLTINGGGGGIFSGTISDGLANNRLQISKSGAGAQTLSGNNTYTGQTAVTGGTLLINGTHVQSTSGAGGGSSANGLYRVSAGATLGGNGRIAGNGSAANTNMILVESGGMLAPGASIGTLTLDGANISGAGSSVLNMASGASFSFELGGDTADRISFWNYTGAGDFLRNNNAINLSLNGTVTAGTYTVTLFDFFSDNGVSITNSGITDGLTLIGASIDPNISSANLIFNADSITLEYTVVPEPSTWVLLTLSLCATTLLRRRRS